MYIFCNTVTASYEKVSSSADLIAAIHTCGVAWEGIDIDKHFNNLQLPFGTWMIDEQHPGSSYNRVFPIFLSDCDIL